MKLPEYSNKELTIFAKRSLGIFLLCNLFPILIGVTVGTSQPDETFWSAYLAVWVLQLCIALAGGFLVIIAWCLGAWE